MHAQPRNYLVNSWLAVFVCFVSIAFFFASMFAIQPSQLRPKRQANAVASELHAAIFQPCRAARHEL
jgi:hypothetical protein